MNKKYELTDETFKLDNGTTLHRVRALCDFGDVKKGQIGGFIESEENLSTNITDTCWVTDNAKVYGHAKILSDAVVGGLAEVFDHATVSGYAKVTGHVTICDFAEISGAPEISGEAHIGECSEIRGQAKIHDNVSIMGRAIVDGNAEIFDSCYITDRARVHGDAQLFNACIVSKDANVRGDVSIFDNVNISTGADICENTDYLCIHLWNDHNGVEYYITYYRDTTRDIRVEYFDGNHYGIDDFKNHISNNESGDNLIRLFASIKNAKNYFNL